MRNPLAGPGNGLAELPDEDLMVLVARGIVQEPATELFARHNRDLFNFLAWLTGGNLAEAEDLAQKTWLRLISRCSDYRPGAATFRTWLFQIARNAFIDARRAASERLRSNVDPEAAIERETTADHSTREAGPDPEASLVAGESRDRLHAALLALPVAQREVVVLRYFGNLSLDEVSATVGAGVETVRSRLRYAYRALRSRLEGGA